jgi:Zn-dependent M28 family amino/carboxypeptidase
MIGRLDTAYEAKGNADYVYIISSFGDSEDLIRYNEAVNNKTTALTLDYKYSDPNDPNAYYRRSDHYNFVKKNVPILFYFNGSHADYHRPTDTIDKINFPILTKRAQLVFNTADSISHSDVRFHRPGK